MPERLGQTGHTATDGIHPGSLYGHRRCSRFFTRGLGACPIQPVRQAMVANTVPRPDLWEFQFRAEPESPGYGRVVWGPANSVRAQSCRGDVR